MSMTKRYDAGELKLELTSENLLGRVILPVDSTICRERDTRLYFVSRVKGNRCSDHTGHFIKKTKFAIKEFWEISSVKSIPGDHSVPELDLYFY